MRKIHKMNSFFIPLLIPCSVSYIFINPPSFSNISRFLLLDTNLLKARTFAFASNKSKLKFSLQKLNARLFVKSRPLVISEISLNIAFRV